jgi:hypothetical protein
MAWVLALVVLVGGSALANEVAKQLAAVPAAATSTQTGVAALEAARQADAPALAGLRGRWVAQIASGQSLDDTAADAYLQQQQAWAARFPVVLARGDDFASNALNASYWLTFANQPFATEAEVQSWCVSNGLDANSCMPRQLPAG